MWYSFWLDFWVTMSVNGWDLQETHMLMSLEMLFYELFFKGWILIGNDCDRVEGEAFWYCDIGLWGA